MSNSVGPLPVKNVTQAALANSKQCTIGPSKVYGISGYNSGPAQFIQFHNVAAAPADGVAPVLNLTVGATSNFSVDFGFHGMDFNLGVYVCNSSTAPTKTIAAADCQFFLRSAVQ